MEVGLPEREEHPNQCPLAAVDRRLEDAHRQWHQAEAAYFEPEGFRLAIQSAIQTLRTVTFILQANKRLIPDFQSWYQEWQDRLRADPLMRWMVDARNQIEKQGDLEVHSYVRAEIIASHLDEGPRQEVKAHLFEGVAELLASIPDNGVGEHVRRHGTLTIQRRWVENKLPDHELLEAVAIAYGRLSELVSSAHEQMGLPSTRTINTENEIVYRAGDRGGRLPCMIGHADDRTLNVSLSDGSRLTVAEGYIPFDLEVAQEAAKSFPAPPEGAFADTSDPVAHLNSLFETARGVFLTSGYHDTIAFFLADGRPFQIAKIDAAEHGQKYLLMRHLANQVAKFGADAVIMLAEMWRAPYDPNAPYRRPADAPNRTEVLSATLVRKEGEPLQLWAEIKREGKTVTLGETSTIEDPALFSFASVYEVWGRPIPESWQAATAAADQENAAR